MVENDLKGPNIKNKFIALNLLCFGYLFLIWGFLIGLVVLIVWFDVLTHAGAATFKLIIVLTVIMWALGKAMWVKIDPPKGRVLMPFEAPKLFQLIEDTRKKLRAPKIFKIIVTSDFNASVVQHPRLGILGQYQNYLMLGLLLLETLSLEQFKAVLAHEMCHLSKKHGKTSLWSYRLMSIWKNLSDKFEGQKGFMNFLFKPFFKNFMPNYLKVSRAYCRQHEFESDAYSADFMGKEETAKTLLRIEIMGESVKEYWKGLDKTVKAQDLPPKEVYLGYIKYMRDAFAMENIKDIVVNVIRRKTMDLDTHPCLTDRLKAVGHFYVSDQVVDVNQKAISFKENIESSCAQLVIEPTLLKQWHDGLVHDWDEDYKKQWYKLREGFYADQKRSKELAEKEISGIALTLGERWEKAKLHDTWEQDDEAAKEFHQLIELNHQVGSAKMLLAKILLKNNDAQGLPLMQEGLVLEPQYGTWASEQLLKYYEKNNDLPKIKQWYDSMMDYDEKGRLAELERRQVLSTDKFKSHEAKPELIEMIRTKAAECPDVKKAYLVCKKTEHAEFKPVYLLVVEIKRKFFASADYINEYKKYFLNQVWPETVFVAVQNQKFISKVRKIPNALVFERKK